MAMNYSHAFHAGNFADIVKHAALLALLGRLQADPAPLAVIDTHGGRGLYDLDAPVKRLAAASVPLPFATHLEDEVLPSVSAAIDTAVRMVNG